MTIRPIDLNGMIQRTQDVGTMKQQEDAKPVLDQQNIQNHFVKQEDKLAKQVNHADNANQEEYRYDAKEKGNSQYRGNGGSKKEKKNKETERVIVKGKSTGFDIKI